MPGRLPYPLSKTFLLVLFFIPQFSVAENSSSPGESYLGFNTYPYLSDIKSDKIITINVATAPQQRFSYYGYLDIGNESRAAAFTDTENFYSEQNFRWQLTKTSPLDLTAQFNFRSGQNDDRQRLGIRWRLHDSPTLDNFFQRLHLNWSVNFHLLQFDQETGRSWQVEHDFKVTFPNLTKRLYVSGFAEQTFNHSDGESIPNNPLVAEVQMGVQIVEFINFAIEYRLNEYRREGVNNLAVGVEYLLTW